MDMEQEELLNSIIYPSDLKKLALDELPQLSNELRQFIIDVVSANPGHCQDRGQPLECAAFAGDPASLRRPE